MCTCVSVSVCAHVLAQSRGPESADAHVWQGPTCSGSVGLAPVSGFPSVSYWNPGKEVVFVALYRLREAEPLAQGHTAAGSKRAARSVPPSQCSGAWLCQVLNDRQAGLSGKPRTSPPHVSGSGTQPSPS